jgi:hypothetical protein
MNYRRERSYVMADSNGRHLVIGLGGIGSQVGGTYYSTDRTIRFSLPDRVDAEHVETTRNDLGAILSAVNDQPEKFQALQNAVLGNDFATANALLDDLGLTEDKLQARGGGLIGAILVGAAVAAAILLYAATADAPTHPPGGAPDAGSAPGGAPDAGPG